MLAHSNQGYDPGSTLRRWSEWLRCRFFIEIAGDIDSLSLWKLIEPYKVNLTAVEGKTWIYGDVWLHHLGTIVERCALYGTLRVDVKGGGPNEQKEEEDS